jgi:hypothetical protein
MSLLFTIFVDGNAWYFMIVLPDAIDFGGRRKIASAADSYETRDLCSALNARRHRHRAAAGDI